MQQADLESIRSAWPDLLKAIEDESPLLLESLQRFAPVAFQKNKLMLKGELDESFLLERLKASSARVLEILQKQAGLSLSACSIVWEQGALTGKEAITQFRRTHLDSGSRFDELKQQNPLVDELYKRMGGRLLKGGPLS